MDTEPLPWMNAAACAQTGGEQFFPEKGDSVADARRVCHACPVAAQCLQYAQTERIKYGVFGGKTAQQRARMLAKSGRAAQAENAA